MPSLKLLMKVLTNLKSGKPIRPKEGWQVLEHLKVVMLAFEAGPPEYVEIAKVLRADYETLFDILSKEI